MSKTRLFLRLKLCHDVARYSYLDAQYPCFLFVVRLLSRVAAVFLPLPPCLHTHLMYPPLLLDASAPTVVPFFSRCVSILAGSSTLSRCARLPFAPEGSRRRFIGSPCAGLAELNGVQILSRHSLPSRLPIFYFCVASRRTGGPPRSASRAAVGWSKFGARQHLDYTRHFFLFCPKISKIMFHGPR